MGGRLAISRALQESRFQMSFDFSCDWQMIVQLPVVSIMPTCSGASYLGKVDFTTESLSVHYSRISRAKIIATKAVNRRINSW